MTQGTAKQGQLLPDAAQDAPESVAGLLLTRNQLAAVFGCTPEYVSTLGKRGMPKSRHGKYPLGEAVRWWVNHWKDKNEATARAGTDETRRKEAARAELLELELEQRKGGTLPRDVLLAFGLQLFNELVNACDAAPVTLPDEVAEMTDRALIAHRIAEHFHHVREHAAQRLQQLGEVEA